MRNIDPTDYEFEFRTVSEDVIEGAHKGETRRFRFKPKPEYSVYTRKTFVGARDIEELAKTLSSRTYCSFARSVWETTRPLAIQ